MHNLFFLNCFSAIQGHIFVIIVLKSKVERDFFVFFFTRPSDSRPQEDKQWFIKVKMSQYLSIWHFMGKLKTQFPGFQPIIQNDDLCKMLYQFA